MLLMFNFCIFYQVRLLPGLPKCTAGDCFTIQLQRHLWQFINQAGFSARIDVQDVPPLFQLVRNSCCPSPMSICP